MTLEAPAATEDIDLSGAPTGSRLSKDLDDVEEAFHKMERGEVLRSVVVV